jgi:hypothetical protein
MFISIYPLMVFVVVFLCKCRPAQHTLDVPSLYVTHYDNATFEDPDYGVGVRVETGRSYSAPGPAWLINVTFFDLPNDTLAGIPFRLALRMPSWTTDGLAVDLSKNGRPAPACPSAQPGNFCTIIDGFSRGAFLHFYGVASNGDSD